MQIIMRRQVNSRAMEVINGLHVTEEGVLHTVQRLGCYRADHRSHVVLQGVYIPQYITLWLVSTDGVVNFESLVPS